MSVYVIVANDDVTVGVIAIAAKLEVSKAQRDEFTATKTGSKRRQETWDHPERWKEMQEVGKQAEAEYRRILVKRGQK